MSQPRAADDFDIIRARMEELRREREAADSDKTSEPISVGSCAICQERKIRCDRSCYD